MKIRLHIFLFFSRVGLAETQRTSLLVLHKQPRALWRIMYIFIGGKKGIFFFSPENGKIPAGCIYYPAVIVTWLTLCFPCSGVQSCTCQMQIWIDPEVETQSFLEILYPSQMEWGEEGRWKESADWRGDCGSQALCRMVSPPLLLSFRLAECDCGWGRIPSCHLQGIPSQIQWLGSLPSLFLFLLPLYLIIPSPSHFILWPNLNIYMWPKVLILMQIFQGQWKLTKPLHISISVTCTGQQLK